MCILKIYDTNINFVSGEALEEMTNAFVKAYDGSVLVTVVTTDVAHTRRRVARSVKNESKQAPVGIQKQNIFS